MDLVYLIINVIVELFVKLDFNVLTQVLVKLREEVLLYVLRKHVDLSLKHGIGKLVYIQVTENVDVVGVHLLRLVKLHSVLTHIVRVLLVMQVRVHQPRRMLRITYH